MIEVKGSTLFLLDARTDLGQWTLRAYDGVKTGFESGFGGLRLNGLKGAGDGIARLIELFDGQRYCRGLTLDGGLDMGDAQLFHLAIIILAAITAVGMEFFHVRCFFHHPIEPVVENRAVIGVIGRHGHIGQQVQFIVRVSGFGDMNGLTPTLIISLVSIGGIGIIRGLKTV